MSNYFVLGGCGFIGRNIVTWLVGCDSCAKIIVADKSRPELSWLTPFQKKCFENPKVFFQQVNLSNQANMTKLFEKHKCDYIINAAAETRLKMSPEVYDEHIFQLGVKCARQAAAVHCKLFVQITSARVVQTHKSHDKSSTAEILKCQLKLEDALKTIEGLKYCIIRPALVYGSGDKRGLTPLLIMGGIYKKLHEEMRLLWTKEVFVNTVHVEDVARACIHVTNLEESGQTWGLADKSNSCQGSIMQLISEIFHIKYKFEGKFKSHMAHNFFEDIVDEINQKHLIPWAEACTAEQIINTPLTPYINEEQLIIEEFDVKGTAIESTGFTYKYPLLNAEQLQIVIDDYILQKLFPRSCMP